MRDVWALWRVARRRGVSGEREREAMTPVVLSFVILHCTHSFELERDCKSELDAMRSGWWVGEAAWAMGCVCDAELKCCAVSVHEGASPVTSPPPPLPPPSGHHHAGCHRQRQERKGREPKPSPQVAPEPRFLPTLCAASAAGGDGSQGRERGLNTFYITDKRRGHTQVLSHIPVTPGPPAAAPLPGHPTAPQSLAAARPPGLHELTP